MKTSTTSKSQQSRVICSKPRPQKAILSFLLNHRKLILHPTYPDSRPIAAFKPAPRVKQRLRWRDHWIQFDVEPSSSNYDGRSYGGSVTVTLHNSKRSVLMELVLAAREEYMRSTVSKVTVHLSDRVGGLVFISVDCAY